MRGGKNQLFLSPGVVFGRFVLFDRLKAVFGISYQFAVSPEITKIPVLTPVYDHAWLLTMRMPFLAQKDRDGPRSLDQSLIAIILSRKPKTRLPN